MNRLLMVLVFLFTPVMGTTLIVSCGGCVSNPAEEKILLPAMRLAWTEVQKNVQTGIDAQLRDGAITEEGAVSLRDLTGSLNIALSKGDLEAIAASPWEVLEPVAQEGITELVRSGQASEGVAVSLRERLKNFTEAIQEVRS